jgi:hypothetical protein
MIEMDCCHGASRFGDRDLEFFSDVARTRRIFWPRQCFATRNRAGWRMLTVLQRLEVRCHKRTELTLFPPIARVGARNQHERCLGLNSCWILLLDSI